MHRVKDARRQEGESLDLGLHPYPGWRSTMNDFAFLGIILAFFALAVLFVAACDRIIGPDEDIAGRTTTEAGAGDKVAA